MRELDQARDLFGWCDVKVMKGFVYPGSLVPELPCLEGFGNHSSEVESIIDSDKTGM